MTVTAAVVAPSLAALAVAVAAAAAVVAAVAASPSIAVAVAVAVAAAVSSSSSSLAARSTASFLILQGLIFYSGFCEIKYHAKKDSQALVAPLPPSCQS